MAVQGTVSVRVGPVAMLFLLLQQFFLVFDLLVSIFVDNCQGVTCSAGWTIVRQLTLATASFVLMMYSAVLTMSIIYHGVQHE